MVAVVSCRPLMIAPLRAVPAFQAVALQHPARWLALPPQRTPALINCSPALPGCRRYAYARRQSKPRYQVLASHRQYKGSLQLLYWSVDVTFGHVTGTGGSFDKRYAYQAAARQALQQLEQLPRVPA